MATLTPNNATDYSTAAELLAACAASSAASIFWQDPSVALWVKAVFANSNVSRGVPGCPSREVADAVYAILGA